MLEFKKGFQVVDFIFTFEVGQEEFATHVPLQALATERKFLNAVFKLLSKAKIRKLLKISCMFVYPGEASVSDLPAFIAHRWGKFHFNDDVNDDEDTRRLARFKAQYLKKKRTFSKFRKVQGSVPMRAAKVRVLDRKDNLLKSEHRLKKQTGG